jgi:hypothetical protein
VNESACFGQADVQQATEGNMLVVMLIGGAGESSHHFFCSLNLIFLFLTKSDAVFNIYPLDG